METNEVSTDATILETNPSTGLPSTGKPRSKAEKRKAEKAKGGRSDGSVSADLAATILASVRPILESRLTPTGGRMTYAMPWESLARECFQGIGVQGRETVSGLSKIAGSAIRAHFGKQGEKAYMSHPWPSHFGTIARILADTLTATKAATTNPLAVQGPVAAIDLAAFGVKL